MSTNSKLLSMCMQMGLPSSGADVPEALPVLLVGSPGTSKTQTVKKIGKRIEERLGCNFPVETIALPQIGAEHLAGLPVPNHTDKTTDLYLIRAGRQLTKAGQGVLFLDEFSSAPDNVAAASLTAIQDGKIGDAELPASVCRVAAMNDPEKATAGRPLMAPESNRFCWINPWELEVDEWVDYMKGGPGVASEIVILPESWERDYFFMATSLVTAFIKTSPSLLLREPEPHKAGSPWPSPRSWRNTTRLIAACLSMGEKINGALVAAAVNGCVGDDVGGQFLVYAHKMDLPDPEEVLALGRKFKMPTRDDKLLCILESVAAVACIKSRPDFKTRWDTACDLIEMVCDTRSDVSLPVIQYLMGHKPANVAVPKVAVKYFKLMNELGLTQK